MHIVIVGHSVLSHLVEDVGDKGLKSGLGLLTDDTLGDGGITLGQLVAYLTDLAMKLGGG